jgi:hypothetical protein
MPYRPENPVQARIDYTFRRLGGQMVPLHVDWAKRLESIHAALILQQLLFEARQHANDDGWFYVTADDMQDVTAVGERGYAAARGKLEQLELLETRRAGVPARLWIRLDMDAIDTWISDVSTPTDQFRHIAELKTTIGGTSNDGSKSKHVQEAEPYIEDENLTTKVQTKTDILSDSIDGMPAESIWDAVLDELSTTDNVKPTDLTGFVRPAQLIGARPDGTLVLRATNEPSRRRLDAYLRHDIERAVGRWLGRSVRIEVTV